ncbi:protein of unknown function [Paenibacillus sp. UNC496MF]|uniref:DUF4184 family protein n=1 Tax=Paenibacillus sp. UNC496MF TaxID=1502753 RepID=UPI0008E6BD4F|nr:DUF4184 family protein [Paenibacillus sp. UNC496MF]SFI51597.1 protein of unknown function [Paenibacillus sp. UNC496MF]
MPFTFSHPLFAVPLRRLAPKLSLTGLVLGSMIPDMEYFMALQSYQTIGHSFRGFVVQGLPLSIAAAAAFHAVVKPALPGLLPATGGLDRFAASLSSDAWKLNSARTWLIFLVSLYIGYWTHIFMDAWTHGSGAFVGWFPPLRAEIGGYGVYKLLQYLFSLIGVAVPGLLLLRRYMRWRGSAGLERLPASAAPGTKALLWTTAAAFGLLLFAAKIVVTGDHNRLVSALIVAPLSSAMFGVFVASLFYRAARNRRLAGAFAAVGLLLLAIASFRISEYVWTPFRLNRPYANFHGDFQSLWNGYLILWSALVLLGCRMTAAKRRPPSAKHGPEGRTRSA